VSPAGRGSAAFQRRDWGRIALVILGAPWIVFCALVAAITAAGSAFGIGFMLFYGFTHAPLYTAAGIAAWCAPALLIDRFAT
jgi:hypothetical protein